MCVTGLQAVLLTVVYGVVGPGHLGYAGQVVVSLPELFLGCYARVALGGVSAAVRRV
ncbi:hypothetical protein [Kitasatospora sp. McL0602]|uniref:hypothetical protein n=1 Tax=Kitasatospora sp. McL0602 TaxID=3439530 RepID=UPI003F8A2D82